MRRNNIETLYDTLDILERGSYEYGGKTVFLKLSRAQREEAHVYLPEDVRKIRESKDFPHVHVAGRCRYGCENADSFTLALKRLEELPDEFEREGARPPLVLNLANPVNPGGGVRRGARAQEEDLCRRSSLLASLEGPRAAAYYEYNRSLRTYMGSDALIIHPRVEIIKDEDGSPLPRTEVVAVMTCAAPMLTNGMERMTQGQYERLLYRRVDGMLRTAAFLGYRYLVLGAFGCGAFHNDARVVSDVFYRVLEEPGPGGIRVKDAFRRVDFAVLDRTYELYNYKEFARNFSPSPTYGEGSAGEKGGGGAPEGKTGPGTPALKYVRKVNYYETDRMGVTHHSNYVRWMEEARIDLFDRAGLSYRLLEEAGVYSPVVSIQCDYKAPTTFEDEVEIEVRAEEFKGVKLVLDYLMTARPDGRTVASARSVHCFTDKDGRLIALKKAYPELYEKLRGMSAPRSGAEEKDSKER